MSVTKDLSKKLSLEARAKFKSLEENYQLLYSTGVCAMCGRKMSVKQLNKVILEGVPNVCAKDYSFVEAELDKLAPLFEQLKLY